VREARRGTQGAGEDEAAQLKAAAAALKRLCRMRTSVAWKDWRASVEAEHAATLQVGTGGRALLAGCGSVTMSAPPAAA